MFDSSIIDIAIGMVFIYLLLSLICSAANEIIERYSRKRARDLENGIKEMFQNPDFVKKLYEHPLIYSLYAKPYESGAKTLPSYIPSRNFALALMGLIGERGAQGATGSTSPVEDAMVNLRSMANLRSMIETNNTMPETVQTALLTFVDSSNNPAKVRENIENWFDSAMDRVSGVYKRRSQLIVLLLGLALSVLLNVNSITLVRALSSDRAMRASLVAAATEYAKNNPLPSPTASPTPKTAETNTSQPKASPRASASPAASPSPVSTATTASGSPTPAPAAATASNSGKCNENTPECRIQNNLHEIERLELPIGWNERVREDFKSDPWRSLLLSLIGWIVTALAVSLGAPFWFDVLNKFIVVRGTVKPKEKSGEEGSKD